MCKKYLFEENVKTQIPTVSYNKYNISCRNLYFCVFSSVYIFSSNKLFLPIDPSKLVISVDWIHQNARSWVDFFRRKVWSQINYTNHFCQNLRDWVDWLKSNLPQRRMPARETLWAWFCHKSLRIISSNKLHFHHFFKLKLQTCLVLDKVQKLEKVYLELFRARVKSKSKVCSNLFIKNYNYFFRVSSLRWRSLWKCSIETLRPRKTATGFVWLRLKVSEKSGVKNFSGELCEDGENFRTSAGKLATTTKVCEEQLWNVHNICVILTEILWKVSWKLWRRL